MGLYSRDWGFGKLHYEEKKQHTVLLASNYQQADKEKNRNKNLYADKRHTPGNNDPKLISRQFIAKTQQASARKALPKWDEQLTAYHLNQTRHWF